MLWSGSAAASPFAKSPRPHRFRWSRLPATWPAPPPGYARSARMVRGGRGTRPNTTPKRATPEGPRSTDPVFVGSTTTVQLAVTRPIDAPVTLGAPPAGGGPPAGPAPFGAPAGPALGER